MNKNLYSKYIKDKASICALLPNFQSEAGPVAEAEEQDCRQAEDQRGGDHVHLCQDDGGGHGVGGDGDDGDVKGGGDHVHLCQDDDDDDDGGGGDGDVRQAED